MLYRDDNKTVTEIRDHLAWDWGVPISLLLLLLLLHLLLLLLHLLLLLTCLLGP